MEELFLNIEKTACVTGHRIVKKNFDKEALTFKFAEIIQSGYDTFLIGMAMGFDMICFRILEHLRNKYAIKIIACIPCKEQDAFFGKKNKQEYERMINSADKVYYVSDKNYDETCMIQRNSFMVDNSSLVVAYVYKNYGGAFYTSKYAEKKNKKVVYVNDL